MGLVHRVRGILASKNLSIYAVAARSRSANPDEAAYHIPPNLYFRLRSANWTPTLYQLAALSQMSDYPLSDWLTVFGFHLDDISRMQAILRRPRTTLLDSTVYDSRAAVTWFRERQPKLLVPHIASLGDILERTDPRPLSVLLPANTSDYIYAKVGMLDAFAFPELLPGSIVRASPQLATPIQQKGSELPTNSIFLIEHQSGICCCRLHPEKSGHLTLQPTQLPFASVEFQFGTEARILGVVDLEFRVLVDPETARTPRCSLPEMAPQLARHWTPKPFGPADDGKRFTDLLRAARLRAGLSLRGASELSHLVARTLGDERYFTSQASLSDYEASDTLPHHIHKLFTLCALYAIPFHELLDSLGLSLGQHAAAAIPDSRIIEAEQQPQPQLHPPDRTTGFLTSLIKQFGTPPFFLREALPSVLGLSDLSLRDIFWVGRQTNVLHPSLSGALFVVVNRKRRTPPAFLRKSLWDRPLYLLARRNGSHALGSCTLEDRLIVLHSHTGTFIRPEQLRNHAEAEVVGQIVGVLRTLPSPS